MPKESTKGQGLRGGARATHERDLQPQQSREKLPPQRSLCQGIYYTVREHRGCKLPRTTA